MYDASLLMSDEQTFDESAAGTNVFSLKQNDKIKTWQSVYGGDGTAKNQKRGLSIGAGIPIYVFVAGNSVVTGAGGAAKIKPRFVNSANNVIATGDSDAIVFPDIEFAASTLSGDYPLTVLEINSGALDEDYVGIFYEVTTPANLTSTSFSAGFTLDKALYLELKTAVREGRGNLLK